MENTSKGSFDLGFTLGFAVLAAVAATLVAFNAPPAALSVWIILSEIIYLNWAAWGEAPHRGDSAAFAVKMNFQAAVRVMYWLAIATILLLTVSLLPNVSLAAIIGAIGPDGDLGSGVMTIFKLGIAASIALATIRLKRAQVRGMCMRSLADGSYCKHSARLAGTISEVDAALQERLVYLSMPGGPKFKQLPRASRLQVVRSEEDGRPISRLYLSGYPLRVTISLRQIDNRHTDVRMWFRLRGAYLLGELFPNPVNVDVLRDFLDAELLDVVKLALKEPAKTATGTPASRNEPTLPDSDLAVA